MELPAQIKKILILLLTIFSINITTAQHQIDKDVTFSLKGEKGFVKLNSFLGYIDYNDIDNCDNASGMFKFQVTSKGKIASIEIEGNLPSGLIEAVKQRILLIQDKWIFSDAIKEKDKNIQFYYPVYIQQSEKCNFKIHESYDLIIKLFKKYSVLSIDNDTYFIEPLVWHAKIR